MGRNRDANGMERTVSLLRLGGKREEDVTNKRRSQKLS